MNQYIAIIFFFLSLLLQPGINQTPKDDLALDPFVLLVFGNESERETAIESIEENWSDASLPKAIESMRFIQDTEIRFKMIRIMEKWTGENHFGAIFGKWSEWSWNRPIAYDSTFAPFKSDLYSLIDFRFAEYFASKNETRIRLDEIIWGGVKQDGIPPLRNPKMISVDEAEYLDDDDLVFGIEINGEHRAYPKRILAWHEMFVDTIQDRELVGVYCTLCGTVILYDTKVDGVHHQMGTSGFLYRSNKLMYDKATSSLWNTFWGEPVAGKLVDSGIRLERLAVVNTKWGEWKKLHPDTSVLSIQTGHTRDYDEGAAYRSYFATDKLMFGVPKRDKRLKNKDEVFTILEGDQLEKSIAIHTKFLKKNSLFQTEFNGRRIVVVRDKSGGVRAFEAGRIEFVSWDRKTFSLEDSTGMTWELHENGLKAGSEKLDRIPAQTAFWFGWVAANPNTVLVK